MMPREQVDEILSRCSRNVSTFGRHVMAILDKPPYSYTIGNSKRGLPELIVFGLAPDVAKIMLNLWSEHMIIRRRAYDDRELVKIAGDGKHSCLAVRCPPEVRDTHTLWVDAVLRDGEYYQVTQMVIPDPAGRFPFDPRCEKPYRDMPILGGRMQ